MMQNNKTILCYYAKIRAFFYRRSRMMQNGKTIIYVSPAKGRTFLPLQNKNNQEIDP